MYRKYSVIHLLIINILLFLNLTAQNKLSGYVFDGSSGQPLPFTNIYVLEKGTGTTSDVNGKFTLDLEPGNYTLRFSFVGYKSETLKITESNFITPLTVKLYSTDILLQEVTVFAKTAENRGDKTVNPLTLQSEKIRNISPAMPDVLRSIQSLPGISANNEFSAEFNVRGGNKDENLVLVNGTQVYEPFHIKEAANASVGIFNVDLIKKVDLVTGGFSAKYGDKMSSVLNIEYREGNRQNYMGSATLSLAYFDGYFEGPLGKNASIIFGARKSYLEYILSLLNFENVSAAKPSFYDLQGVLAYHLSPRNKILIDFIHSGDDFVYEPVNKPTESSHFGEYKGEQAFYKENLNRNENNNATYFSSLFDIQSQNVLSGNSLLNMEIAYYDQIDNENRFVQSLFDQKISASNNYFKFIDNRRELNDYLRIKTIQGKINFEHLFSPFYNFDAGLDFRNITYNQKSRDDKIVENTNNMSNFPDTTYKKTVRNSIELENDTLQVTSYKFSGYLDNTFQVSKHLLLDLGARFDYFDMNKEVNLSPRISASFTTNKGTTFRAAWGYFYQSPKFKQLAYRTPTDSNTLAQRAIHYILGVEHRFVFDPVSNHSLNIRIEGFYKKYDNLISSFYSAFDRLTYTKVNDAAGFARGIEFYATVNLSWLYAWVSYGYLDAKEDVAGDNLGEFPRFTDQTHTLAAVLSINFGKGWKFNSGFYYGSGYPYTPRVAVFDQQKFVWNWVKQDKNSAHLPPYKRLDVKISKDINFSSFKLNLFLDASNVLFFKNIQGYEYKIDAAGNPSKKEVELWPVVPTFGIKFIFK